MSAREAAPIAPVSGPAAPPMDAGVRIGTVYGQCPVQAEGTIDGVPFYFRARGNHWSIEVGPGNTASWLAADDDARATLEATPPWRYEQPYGFRPYAAGWMDHEEARRFIAEAARFWRVAHRTPGDTQ